MEAKVCPAAIPPEDDMDIPWAGAQGIEDRKRGSACESYKAFLTRYDLVHTYYTQRMWDTYRKSVRGKRSKQKKKRAPRAALTPMEWDAKFNASAIMRQVNASDTLVDAWR